MPRKHPPRLKALERFEAKVIIADLLAAMERPMVIRRALEVQYGKKRITDDVARALFTEVRKEWANQAEVAKPERRQEYLQILRRLFIKAEGAKEWAECRRIVALMGKFDGMEIIPKETGITPQDDDFDGRSENELVFYGDHGHWPEDDAVAGDPEESTVH